MKFLFFLLVHHSTTKDFKVSSPRYFTPIVPQPSLVVSWSSSTSTTAPTLAGAAWSIGHFTLQAFTTAAQAIDRSVAPPNGVAHVFYSRTFQHKRKAFMSRCCFCFFFLNPSCFLHGWANSWLTSPQNQAYHLSEVSMTVLLQIIIMCYFFTFFRRDIFA